MRAILIVLIFTLSALLIYGFLEYREMLFRIKGEERESAERERQLLSLYEKKLKDLEGEYLSLVQKRDRLNIQDKKKLEELEKKIAEMKGIIEEWKATEEEKKRNALYRMCVETYSQTRRHCEYLREKVKE